MRNLKTASIFQGLVLLLVFLSFSLARALEEEASIHLMGSNRGNPTTLKYREKNKIFSSTHWLKSHLKNYLPCFILHCDNQPLPIFKRVSRNDQNRRALRKELHEPKNRLFMGYLHTQSQSPAESRINISDISPKLTHTFFAFVKVLGETAECVVTDIYLDTQDTSPLPLTELNNNFDPSCAPKDRAHGNLAALFALKKQNPHMRVLMSIGGAGEEITKNFTQATSTDSKISNLANSCVKLALDYGLDGVDYDWEFPSNLNEWENFSKLLKKTREIMNTFKYNPSLLISAALLPSAFTSNDSMKAIPKIASELDFLNLMTYDNAIGSDKALHNSPLYPSARPGGLMTINGSVTDALKYFPSNKIIVGQPLYGYLMKVNNSSDSFDSLSSKGLLETVSIPSEATKLNAFTALSYNTVRDSYLANRNFTRVWDNDAKAAWLFNNMTNEFITYPDNDSISAVLNYIEEQDLGGIFFWQLGGSFNRKNLKEELIEFTASKINSAYKKLDVCAPQSPFCNIKSNCHLKEISQSIIEKVSISPNSTNGLQISSNSFASTFYTQGYMLSVIVNILLAFWLSLST